MELRHSRNMVGTSATETKNKRNAREDVLEKLIKRRRRIGSSPRLSEEISRKTANNDSSQLQYFHDWTRRSSGWTAGIRDYVIVGRREQIWAERERKEGTYLVQIDLLLGIQVRTLEDRIVRVDRIVGPRDTGQNQHH